MNLRSWREPKWFSTLLIILCCVPAALAIGAMASDIITHTRFFGSDPIKEGEHFLGEWTLRFIIATLAVTPLRQLTGWNWLAKHRRTLGLFAFGYVSLHWLTYALLDVQLDWGDLVKDLTKRPYIMIGMAALLCMAPLAFTSTRNSIRRLGGKRWNRLHKLIYPIAILGVIHFAMAVKKDESDPITYGACIAFLLAWRVVRWWMRREAPQRATLAGAP
ncbi:MAG TPA: protein-methionine-sulfoxide reductase heme-binding subunit MsrQ [Gemmatimonadaceae bacterium]|nr:protein-methionine-sulfoxide reductase heme-binding subunit MsrQ [Gemmatimonadaceae bacterium]